MSRGICPICGMIDDLVPVQAYVCTSCLSRLHGNTVATGILSGPGFCDICGYYKLNTIKLHIMACPSCAMKIARRQASRNYNDSWFWRRMEREGILIPFSATRKELVRRGGVQGILRDKTKR